MVDSGGNCHAMASAISASGTAASLSQASDGRRRGKRSPNSAGDDLAALDRALGIGDALDVFGKLAVVRLAVVDRHAGDGRARSACRRRGSASPIRQRLRGLLRRRRRNDRRAGARASRRLRRARRRCAPRCARSHSLSVPIERLLRLAEPMRSNRSSMIITLECTMVCGDALAVAHLRADQADAVGRRPPPAACAGSGCGRCAWCGSRARCRACAARPSRTSSSGFSLQPLRQRLGDRRAGEELVLDVDRALGRARSCRRTAPRPPAPPAGLRSPAACARSRSRRR